MTYLKQHQGMENFMESLVRDPGRYEPVVQFLDNIIKDSDELSWSELEAVGLEVAEALSSDFCAKLRRGMLNALATDSPSPARLKSLKSFARRLVTLPGGIDAQSIEELRQFGLTDQAIENIIGWICILQFYSVLDHAFGFQELPQQALNEVAAGTVQHKGYVPSFHYFVGMARSGAGRA